MNELIKVDINKEDFYESTVSARRIYELLEVKAKFTDWFKYHAENMRLVEGVHYTKVTYKDAHNDENFASQFYEAKKTGSGGHNKAEYIIPVRIAEHMAMASQTRMAYKIRDIFIDIKNRYFAERDADKALRDDLEYNKALRNDPDYILDQALQLSNQALQISQKRVSDLKAKLLEDRAKKEYFDEVLDTGDLVLVSNIAANYLDPKGNALSGEKLNTFLKAKEVIFTRRKGGKNNWSMHKKYRQLGWGRMAPKEYDDPWGVRRFKEYLLYTYVGWVGINNMLIEAGYTRIGGGWDDIEKEVVILGNGSRRETQLSIGDGSGFFPPDYDESKYDQSEFFFNDDSSKDDSSKDDSSKDDSRKNDNKKKEKVVLGKFLKRG